MMTDRMCANIKVVKSTGRMHLTPVTLLLGTSSSGKSSLVQSLLVERTAPGGDCPSAAYVAVDRNGEEPVDRDGLSEHFSQLHQLEA